MKTGTRQMMGALAAAALVHAGVAALVLWSPSQPGAQQAGLGGLEIALGPAGAAPGTVDAVDAEPVPQETVQPETVEQVVPETEVAVVEPVTEPEPVPVAEAIPVETPEPVRTQEPPPEVTKPPPPVKPSPPKTVAETTPKPVKAAEAEPVKEKRPDSERQTASIAGAAGKSGTQAQGRTGSSESQTGGGMPGAKADYFSLLRAWLERYKEYPRSARLRRREGTVMLRFAMNTGGDVLSFEIERSSGYNDLDRAVKEMIVRAQPLPPVPDGLSEGRLELVVPIQFFLR